METGGCVDVLQIGAICAPTVRRLPLLAGSIRQFGSKVLGWPLRGFSEWRL
jgi:hypothetical protein